MKAVVTVPVEMIRALIDLALSGDAACSGRMDDEEVEMLRGAAVAIGMDPMDATPTGFVCKYSGGHVLGDWHFPAGNRMGTLPSRRCGRCSYYEFGSWDLCTTSARRP